MARGSIGQADFTFDTATGLESELDSITLNFDVPVAEITAFSDAYQNVVAGKPSAKIDVSGNWDSTASGGDATIFGELGTAAKAYDFEPDGTTGYNGYAVVTKYSVVASINDAVKYSASFQHNGCSAAIDAGAPTRG